MGSIIVLFCSKYDQKLFKYFSNKRHNNKKRQPNTAATETVDLFWGDSGLAKPATRTLCKRTYL